MTKVTFYKKSGIYYGFTETGHAGLGEMGGVDELCAALSAMTMLVVNTIEVSFGGDIDYRYDPDTADVQVIARSALPDYDSDERKRYAVSGVIQGYCLQLADMLEDYYDYLDVIETEEEPELIG